jgi:hypothetical protein
MSKSNNHIAKLGLSARDKVTGLTGVVTSVCFDLYGCIQVVISPAIKEDGNVPDARWYDINRVEFSEYERVMPVPNFDFGHIAEGGKGPAEKPLP